MRKVMLFALMAVLMPALSPGQAYNGLYCGHTGFNANINSASKSFKCKPTAMTRGTGVLTVTAGVGTATVTNNGFAPIATPSAVIPPIADETFFYTSGLRATIGGIGVWFSVTAKASSTSITIADGNALPAVTGTTSDWSFWNTECLRSSASYSSQSAWGVLHGDQRLWGTLGSATIFPEGGGLTPISQFMLSATGSATSANGTFYYRQTHIKSTGVLAATVSENTSSGVPGVWSSAAAPSVADVLYPIGIEFLLSRQSTIGDHFGYVCMVRAEGVR